MTRMALFIGGADLAALQAAGRAGGLSRSGSASSNDVLDLTLRAVDVDLRICFMTSSYSDVFS